MTKYDITNEKNENFLFIGEEFYRGMRYELPQRLITKTYAVSTELDLDRLKLF